MPSGQRLSSVSQCSVLSPSLLKFMVWMSFTRGFSQVCCLAPWPYAFAALTMKSVEREWSLVKECMRQFPSIIDGTREPDYEKCLVISTSLSERNVRCWTTSNIELLDYRISVRKVDMCRFAVSGSCVKRPTCGQQDIATSFLSLARMSHGMSVIGLSLPQTDELLEQLLWPMHHLLDFFPWKRYGRSRARTEINAAFDEDRILDQVQLAISMSNIGSAWGNAKKAHLFGRAWRRPQPKGSSAQKFGVGRHCGR